MARTILIADDDPYIIEMLRETLTAAGYSVVLADSGSAAVDAYVADKPDLILLDLMMPDLSGDRALPYFDGTPAIVISAKTDVTDKVELLHGGAVDYVTKPFDVRELIARIELRLAERFGGDDAEYNGLKLDSERVAHCGERSVRLTRTEYAIFWTEYRLTRPIALTVRSKFTSVIYEVSFANCAGANFSYRYGE